MNTPDDAYLAFCSGRYPLPTEDQVAALERRIGIALPPDYRRFLLSHNGGDFSGPDILPPLDDCPRDRLAFLHGINAPRPEAELATEGDLALFEGNSPPQVIPIGETASGGLLLLFTAGEDLGAIALKVAYSAECFFLAPGIDAFLGLLRAPSDATD